jgi:hypothetical protein
VLAVAGFSLAVHPLAEDGVGAPEAGALECLVAEFFAAGLDEFHHQGGPAGLVGGTEAFAGLGVEVFVEEQQVPPVGDVAVAVGVAEAGAVAAFAGAEERDEAVADVDGGLLEGLLDAGAGGILDLEGVAVEVVVALEGFDDEKIGGEPIGPGFESQSS